MLSFLKNHPFGVEATFGSSVVITFAVPKEYCEKLVPECLEPDVFDNRWAFIAVAMVQTRNLRPKGFPALMGNDFFLIGYRVFVRYKDNRGKRLRGLYILKSETDSKRMEFLGNIFTHYKYTTTDITQTEKDSITYISSKQSGFEVAFNEMADASIQLPQGSPFSTWHEARRFAGPLPFTFTYLPPTKQVLIIEGVRENWTPQPIHIAHQQFSFLKTLSIPVAQLASGFIVKNVPYSWKKGKIEDV